MTAIASKGSVETNREPSIAWLKANPPSSPYDLRTKWISFLCLCLQGEEEEIRFIAKLASPLPSYLSLPSVKLLQVTMSRER